MGDLSRMRCFRITIGIPRGIVFLLLLSLSLFMQVQPGAAQKQKLEKSYKEWLERDATYFITKEERNAFLKLTSDEARDQFIQNFWELRNPTPGSAENTFKDDVYKRIAYANSHFGAGSGGEGWYSDRGRTYITLGPPQQTEVHYNAANLYPLEIWFYSFNHPALPPFFYVMFYRREGFGDFRYYSPFTDGPDKLVTGTRAVNDPQKALHLIQDSVGSEVARVSLSLLPDEPVDYTTARPSLQSDIVLATIRGLANHPLTKQALNERRAMTANITSRIVLKGHNLDITTLPVRDSRGLTRLDYAIRFRNPSDLSMTELKDGGYGYSVEARVRVFSPNSGVIFTQERTVSGKVGKDELASVSDKRFGYEGSLPLPPGKYRLEFLLSDLQKKTGFQDEAEVSVPAVDASGPVISGVLPFVVAEAADPATADFTPFVLAGLKFTPLGSSPPILSPDQGLQVAYQIWQEPKPPSTSGGDAKQALQVEYAMGRPAVPGGTTTVKEEISAGQFDGGGSLVNGKKFSLDGQPLGNYMLTVTVSQPGSGHRAFGTLSFSILTSSSLANTWDVTDPLARQDAEKGVWDEQRGLCDLAAGKRDEARALFRHALDRNHSDEIARSRLVDAYYARKDYAAILSLYHDAGITDQSDLETILRIAESFDQTGKVQDAISVLESTLTSRPESGPLYLSLAAYYRKIGNTKKAAELEAKGKSRLAPSPAP
jgi:GWxTD domain-containing protein